MKGGVAIRESGKRYVEVKERAVAGATKTLQNSELPLQGIEAERTGFEPVMPVSRHTGLAIRRFRPLSHLSERVRDDGLCSNRPLALRPTIMRLPLKAKPRISSAITLVIDVDATPG